MISWEIVCISKTNSVFFMQRGCAPKWPVKVSVKVTLRLLELIAKSVAISMFINKSQSLQTKLLDGNIATN